MERNNNNITGKKLLSLFKRFYGYTKPDITRVTLNFVVITCLTLTGAVLIWMVGQGFDALNKTNFEVVPAYLIAFIGLVILLQAFRYTNYYLHEWMQQRIINEVRRNMYSHILELGPTFKDKHATGDLLTRLGQDAVKLSEFLVLMPAHIFMYGLTVTLYISILFYIDSGLTLLTLLLIPFIVLQQRYFVRKTRKTAHSFLDYQGRMGAFEEESLRNIQGVVTFSASTSMLKKFDALFSGFRLAAMKNLLLNNIFIVTFELLIAIAAIFLVTVGVNRISQNTLTVGGLINFLLYLGYLSVPLRGLTNIPIESQMRAVAAERIAEILDQRPKIQDKESAKDLVNVLGAISFREVSFGYIKNSPVLNNVTLHIEPREYVAIMGSSGVGKTTFAKLLLRLYDVENGRIIIDGMDIRNISLRSLRSHIAVVWQEPFLINDTIYENMRLCKPDAADDEIREALGNAFATEFIEKLPKGYETHLGHYGDKLSTGQKQRIAIAQAFLKKSSILILDEATSALDSRSEIEVQQALNKLNEQCTVIVIAHRMSTVVNADKVIYINNDNTVTVGTHLELQSTHIPFRNAHIHQSEVKTVN